jgi:DNA-directed RNA polymerase subunit M/transcription elongation factor TFIIS
MTEDTVTIFSILKRYKDNNLQDTNIHAIVEIIISMGKLRSNHNIADPQYDRKLKFFICMYTRLTCDLLSSHMPFEAIQDRLQNNPVYHDNDNNSIEYHNIIKHELEPTNTNHNPKCSKCRIGVMNYLGTKQTRSADEGSTVFLKCSHCNRQVRT